MSFSLNDEGHREKGTIDRHIHMICHDILAYYR